MSKSYVSGFLQEGLGEDMSKSLGEGWPLLHLNMGREDMRRELQEAGYPHHLVQEAGESPLG